MVPFPSARHRPARPSTHAGALELGAAAARHFSAASMVVAPCLAVYEIGVAIGDLHDLAVAALHPAVPARVVSIAPAGGSSRPDTGAQMVLAFQPAPNAASCQVKTHLPAGPAAVQAGETVTVVPRSGSCEAPILPFAAGSPGSALLLATALLVSAVSAWKLWAWLEHLAAGPEPEPAPAQGLLLDGRP